MVVELVRCVLFIAVAIVVVCLPHMQVQLKIWAGLNGLNSLVSFIASTVEFSKVATSSVLEWFGIIFAVGFWIYGATIVIIQEKHKEDHLPSRWWLMTAMIAVDIIFTLVQYILSLKANKEAYLSDDEEVLL